MSSPRVVRNIVAYPAFIRDVWNSRIAASSGRSYPDAGNGSARITGAVYDMYGPAMDATRPAGEWNETRILVDGTSVEHWLNGEKIVEYELFSDDWNERVANSKWAGEADYGRMSRGHIALPFPSEEPVRSTGRSREGVAFPLQAKARRGSSPCSGSCDDDPGPRPTQS